MTTFRLLPLPAIGTTPPFKAAPPAPAADDARDACVAALRELVRLKRLKDSAESDGSAHERALTLHDYKRQRPAAWAAATSALRAYDERSGS